jgi:hypothetical protein
LIDTIVKTEDKSERGLIGFIAQLRIMSLDPKGHSNIEWLYKAVRQGKKAKKGGTR